ncbi:MAG TPA: hypothetical protein VMV69_22130 [Pirellulales bacterium]|nr:hypothetical protein [Pirellulales bacterium]
MSGTEDPTGEHKVGITNAQENNPDRRIADLTAEMNARFQAGEYLDAARIAFSITGLGKDELRQTMNAKKSVRQIAEEMNAEAKRKGMHLDRDPWSIPADPNFDVFDRLTPEEEALTAQLRSERFARAEAAKHATEPASAVAVVLEWRFSPADYFEEPVTISRDDYTMTIDNGKVEARIASAACDANPSMRAVLDEGLNGRFLGVQLLSHRPYELSKLTMTRLHPDGRREFFMETEPGHFRITGGSVDFQVIDKNENVLSDSRRDRIDKKKRLAELVCTYLASDGLLGALLKSYKTGVDDPDNELVHLYEIREALSTKFGGESATRSALSVSSSDWSRLGQLCNDEPVRQGRHRGKSAGALREATKTELAEARGIARAMVEAYLQYLEKAAAGAGTP